MTQETKTPLLEAIVSDILNEVARLSPADSVQAYAYGSAMGIIRKHCAALPVEELARAIYNQNRTVVDGIFDGRLERNKVLSWEECKKHVPADAKAAEDAAQAVMKLLRKE